MYVNSTTTLFLTETIPNDLKIVLLKQAAISPFISSDLVTTL